MKDYRITKEQIEVLSVTSPEAEHYLKEHFPKAFKKDLKVGRWYKSIKGNFLVNYQSDSLENYGFWENQVFKDDIAFGSYWSNLCVEATPQEVEIALIAEAKRKGYKKGNFKCPLSRESQFSEDYNEWYFESLTNSLYTKGAGKGGACIFKEGKWAEILVPGKQVISMRKALKIIAKKLKVSPEDIKIEQYEKTL